MRDWSTHVRGRNYTRRKRHPLAHVVKGNRREEGCSPETKQVEVELERPAEESEENRFQSNNNSQGYNQVVGNT